VTSDIGALRLALPYLRPYRGRVILAGIALLTSAGLLLSLGQALRHLVDAGFASGEAGALDRTALALFGTVLLLGGFTALRFFLVSWLGERVAADLRRDVFAHVLSLSPAWFETARTGDVLARLTADIALLQALIGTAVSQGLRNLVIGLGALAMVLVTSPKLAAIVLLIVPVVVVPLVLFGRREKRLSRTAQERVADVAAAVEEAISGIRTVQAFTQEPEVQAGFEQRQEAAVMAAQRRIASRATLLFAVVALGFGTIIFALWVGGRDVVAGRMSGGELAAFVLYAVMLANAGAQLSEVWGEVQRAAGAAERLFEVLRVAPAIRIPAAPRPLPEPVLGRIVFAGVRFSYPTRPGQWALDGLDLVVEPGETIALVGPSGAGKSTVLHLLLRFYDPQEGHITLDGIDLRDLAPAALRARLGLVPQDPVIFSEDAAANIRLGRPWASEAEVRAAARAAAADGFIAALPAGYATHLGAKGVTLSGGQRQRLAIARAVLRDPAVLLLDEATSALDAESEQAVQQALAGLSRGRTTLVVAHRLATIRRADRILVLDHGRVVASGDHAALLAGGGLYRRLAALQFDLAG
jgi:ATP-binding cassette subfamily B protein